MIGLYLQEFEFHDAGLQLIVADDDSQRRVAGFLDLRQQFSDDFQLRAIQNAYMMMIDTLRQNREQT